MKGLPANLVTLGARRHGVLLPSDLTAAGIDRSARRRRQQAGMLRAIAYGVFVIPELQDALSLVAAAQLLLPASVAVGATAAKVWGLDGYRGDIPLELAVPGRHRRRDLGSPKGNSRRSGPSACTTASGWRRRSGP
jgi:hypothetical protein